MKDKLHVSHLTFDGSANYQIWVGGHVASNWSDRMEGMSVRQPANEDGPVVTLLEGQLIDQAALAGLLNTIYEMHLVVLSVECMSVSQEHSSPSQSDETSR